MINVFISSTFQDLRSYREEVRRTVLDHQCFPNAMENFNASDINALQYCYDKLQDADIFIGIYAHRYGYVPSSDLVYRTTSGEKRYGDNVTSLTHLEYKWALERRIPKLIFIADPENSEDLRMYKEDESQNQRLRDFINHLTKNHTAKFFDTPDDLARKVGASLAAELIELHRFPKITGNRTSKDIPKLTSQQENCAKDTSSFIRLIAPPGTGKSLVIEDRVRRLLSQGVDPDRIAVVSFTRAASRDLSRRILRYCEAHGIPNASGVSVSTLHSLALKVLQSANRLTDYPATPKVLDKWELRNVFDIEFSTTIRQTRSDLANLTEGRAKLVRAAWEAYWSTGDQNPPNYASPNPPITPVERQALEHFHTVVSQIYSYVLPGELIKKCVDEFNVKRIDPVAILGISHLIVDEFQDLNPIDMRFIDIFVTGGVNVFIAGDDDQSIYSFRFADPSGIHEFNIDHPNSETYNLSECFRCTPEILVKANNLISNHRLVANADRARPFSFCQDYQPPLSGTLSQWRFSTTDEEFQAIAQSCSKLVQQGILPRDILILIATRNALPKDVEALASYFERHGLSVEMPTGENYINIKSGRFVYALINLACDDYAQNYVAIRTLLGLMKGVGLPTCISIRDKIAKHNLNYYKIFTDLRKYDVFSSKENKAIGKLSDICLALDDYNKTDAFEELKPKIIEILNTHFGGDAVKEFLDNVAWFPDGININEVRYLLGSDNSDQQELILEDVYNRLKLPIPSNGTLPQRVRVMTMHGSKGLEADVVFIPSFAEEVLPGEKRKGYAGLILEAARLLYVSITRARFSCIISFANSRTEKHHKRDLRTLSRFSKYLGGEFVTRTSSLSDDEVSELVRMNHLYNEHKRTRKELFNTD